MIHQTGSTWLELARVEWSLAKEKKRGKQLEKKKESETMDGAKGLGQTRTGSIVVNRESNCR